MLPIKTALRREVDKLIARYNSYCRRRALDRDRFSRRTGLKAKAPNSTKPAHWKVHPHFDPFYVRSRLDSISHATGKKLNDGAFEPDPILLAEIDKPGGGKREISILSVPDAAVSYALGHDLIARNAHFFSSYTYAYRADRNAHHAIQHLMTDLRDRNRVFVLEYDFARYFDSIKHDYLRSNLERYFLVTKRELQLISRLLKSRRAHGLTEYRNENFEVPERGIPQGSTLSLFLANVACHELDREIEKTGAIFARYADDTVILCDSYDKADKCACFILAHEKRSGAAVNFSKSPGISLLSPARVGEIKTKASIDFLAHSLSSQGVQMSEKSVRRVKQRVSRIVYQHLLLQPKRGRLSQDRVGAGFRDWDLVTCVNEIRRYIYGRMTDSELTNALQGNGRFNLTRCAMSFYPTVDSHNSDIFKALDGWLCDTIVRAYTRRVSLLRRLGLAIEPIERGAMVSGDWYRFPSIPVETRLPSFFKSWLYVRRCARIFGLSKFPSPVYEYV